MIVVHFVTILWLSSLSSAHWNLLRYAGGPRFIESGYLDDIRGYRQEASNESQILNTDADLNKTEVLDIGAEVGELADLDVDSLKQNGHNSCPCASAINNRRFLKRIVGGFLVPDTISFSYQALFLASGYACGATILNRRYLLTAMHCLAGKNGLDHSPEDALIFIGSNTLSRSTGQVLKATKFIKHPDFNRKRLENDIAIVEVDEDIEFDDNVHPACLPTTSTEKYVGRDAVVTGWGATVGYDNVAPEDPKFPKSLKQAEVTVLESNDSNCFRDSLGDGVRKMCAYKNGTDACQGDSGGPLTVVEDGVYVVIGVISYGFGCAAENHPGVYARVNNYLQWIVDNTKEGRC